MTVRVDFYLLNQAHPQVLAHYTCRLLNKAYQAGLRLFVLTESAAQSAQIDALLWTSSDANFIPHAMIESPEAADPLTKICIGHTMTGTQLQAEPPVFDMLVNLQNSLSLEGVQFDRVAELVSADEIHKRAARKRYAAWRDSGAEQHLHNIELN
jgi:DNA polymerase-3 subunit chi